MPAPYVELQVTSNYSFLRGASHVEELLAAAKLLDHDTLALCDWNTLAGIARGHARATTCGCTCCARWPRWRASPRW